MTTLIAAIIAALAAIVAAVLSYNAVGATNRAVDVQRVHDYRVRQLNELYGPLYMRRSLSRRLWKQLPGVPDAEPGVTQWKLIEHIEEIKAEPDGHRRLIVENILQINDELSTLVVGKAGLLEQFPPPKSFETFLEHAATLRMHWERGTNAAGVTFIPFPGNIDADIKAAIDLLRARL